MDCLTLGESPSALHPIKRHATMPGRPNITQQIRNVKEQVYLRRSYKIKYASQLVANCTKIRQNVIVIYENAQLLLIKRYFYISWFAG